MQAPQEALERQLPRALDVELLLSTVDEVAPGGAADRQDGNGDAHVKAGLVGPSETIPVIDGALGLSTWQGIFFCEFDGPRPDRRISVTIVADE